jgi:hypothetical protein
MKLLERIKFLLRSFTIKIKIYCKSMEEVIKRISRYLLL